MTTQETALTRYVQVNGVKLAYRLIGEPTAQPPVVFLNQFRSSVDLWDPLVVNPIAATREVITVDYRGIGQSAGTVHLNFRAFAKDIVAFVRAILPTLPGKPEKVDLLGFSMGGFIIQMAALEAPELFGRLVISGSGTPGAIGPNATRNQEEARSLLAMDPAYVPGLLAAHFPPYIPLAEEGGAWATRIMSARANIAGKDGEPAFANFLGGEPLHRLYQAYMAFDADAEVYALLGGIQNDVLITAGSNDMIVPTNTAYALAQAIPKSYLLIFPGSGHGHLFQYNKHYTKQVISFLDGEFPMPPAAGSIPGLYAQ